MKIKNISTSQFAGIKDKSIRFEDGLNIVYGENESGKSTLLNLLSAALFKEAKLDRRKDAAFVESYFPSAVKGGIAGDFIDGKVTFETADGQFTVSKEWGAEPSVRLSTPQTTVRAQSTVNELLKQQLVYGEGVYAGMLFSPRKDNEFALRTILNDFADKKDKDNSIRQELAATITMAFAESDSVSIDTIENAIEQKIDALSRRWDVTTDMPVRKSGGGRYLNGVGAVLNAYYNLEDSRAVLNEIQARKKTAEEASAAYKEAEAQLKDVENDCTEFEQFYNRLATQAERKNSIELQNKMLAEYKTVLKNWPVYLEETEKAAKLSDEMNKRRIADMYTKAKVYKEQADAYRKSIDGKPCPAAEEIRQVTECSRKITQLENRLCGINLNAIVRMMAGHTVQIVSVLTGEEIALTDGNAAITEAVRIIVPGVMEMELSPADVNVADVENSITANRDIINGIFAKYTVESVEQMEAVRNEILEIQNQLEKTQANMDALLGTISFDRLEAAFESITGEIRQASDIQADIRELCGPQTPDRFISSREAFTDSYAEKYTSIGELKGICFDITQKLAELTDSIDKLDNIPEKYQDISSPDDYLQDLRDVRGDMQVRKQDALIRKTNAVAALENYESNLTEDPYAAVTKAETAFEEQKALLNHWLHIRQVFTQQKASLTNNPMEGLADSFMSYLDIITEGKITSEFPDGDKLNMNIYSSDRLMSYSKLSEGTKDTVALAFRLAVLDHLFPDGGGVIVLDDPFTDMDTARTHQACKLLQQCATRHQIIFLTCREEYNDLLQGNIIEM